MAIGHRRRVMEKVFKNGIETLLEYEFLELCLFSVYKRCDTNSVSRALLNKFGSLDNVCNAPIEELKQVEGVGNAAAEYIKLIPLISKGYSVHTSVRKKRVYKTRESMCKRCVALLKGCKNEVSYVLCFDNSHHLLKEVKISEGTPASVSMEPRTIMNAIANSATTRVMLCHNHPSGVRIPSRQDMMTTMSLKNLLKPIGVELIDHIVVVEDEYISCITLEE